MGEIVDYAAEYETVVRLAKMLETVTEEYKATESYALFTAVLCWVVQRARTAPHLNGLGDAEAKSVKAELEGQKIEEAPWLIQNLGEMSAFDFFKHMRDAVAHGDFRRIRPINENGYLKGHSFELRGNNGNNFIASVDLRRADMKRLGCGLAELYCKAMRSAGATYAGLGPIPELQELEPAE
jgi:hypothetical protein